MKVDSGILVYSNSTVPMKAALFDTTFNVLWEIESDRIPQGLNQIVDFCQFGKDYVLLVTNSEGNENGLVFIDQNGKSIEVRNLHHDGYVTAIACNQDVMYVLLNEQQGELSSFYLVTTNRNGDNETKRVILSKSADVTLTDLFVSEQGYLYFGSRNHGSRPPEVVVIQHNINTESFQVQDITEVKDTMSQTIVLSNNTIMIWGICAGEDGQGDGRIICKTYSLVY